MGKRSTNLLGGDYHCISDLYGDMGSGDDSYTISRVKGTTAVYEFDKEGYVSKITTRVDKREYKKTVATGEEELVKNYSDNFTYTITYTK